MMKTTPTVHYPMTIFYDASCPLCLREVTLLKQYDPENQILLTDCSPLDFAPLEGHGREAMMRLIHSRDASGQWLVGAPVFAAAYHAAGFASVANLWGSARLQPFWRVVYPWIADHRIMLSKLGATSALGSILNFLHRRAAKKAAAAAKSCGDQSCQPTEPPSSKK